ncbi:MULTISPECIES: TonB-dependent receptor [unclassified Lysobacter]|uniref:TonB-dependent receptor domain-containing protein n=1 Tax=unclassified Lysobacter TaxID=2635362 RepID=UPI001F55CDC8|nr:MULTISPECIES: TonB-dependent receptor [unclassified Lysobacter]
MTFKTTKLRDAITFALAVGLSGPGLAFAQDAAAQQTTPPAESQEATELDTIVVTGTRIQSQTVTSSSPVTEIQQEEFKYSGATRAEDLVNQYPQVAPAFDAFTNNGSLGYPTVNLRNMGADRTLTLVNGFRLPPGAGEVPDISIVPAALVKRVDLLTGGASAVYGSDAIAGVVNFVLDDEFEGVSLSAGYSAYQHNNDNDYIQGLMDARDFDYPTGDSGFDGASRNLDLAVGSSFADGRGHAVAWLNWRKNDPLFQGQRDYSSCALTASGLGCGGSNTNAAGNFYWEQGGFDTYGPASLNPDGSWIGAYGAPYNYAPINYYQRPDERYTAGASIKYEINEHFRPYMDLMFINKSDSVQIAESGAFFTRLPDLACTDPLIGTMCADLGLDPAVPVGIYVAKRNIEGGPRISQTDNTQWRVVAGVEGALDEAWSYNASFLHGEVSNTTIGKNDFLSDRIVQAILGCPDGSFAGCIPYDVFTPGGVTAEAAAALAGTSLSKVDTELNQINAYITGDTGLSLPWVDENVSLVMGAEWRENKFSFVADTNSETGNFAGSGGFATPVSGKTSVTEVFLESAVPLFRSEGLLRSLDMDLGFRHSDYNLSGGANTWKAGLGANFIDKFRVRTGYNHAIRAPSVTELFTQQTVGLFGGSDPCAGPTPTLTPEQCLNTGVPLDRYGSIAANPADQNNFLGGGNPDLAPEVADTFTFGVVYTPTNNLQFNVDYYDIKLEDAIGGIGPTNILQICGLTGDPSMCDRIHRGPAGDLWRANTSYVEDTLANVGEQHFRGIDLGGMYRFDLGPGRLMLSLNGTYTLEQEFVPLPQDKTTAYDCAGVINPSCRQAEWRHIATARYSLDDYTFNLRWRYIGALDYELEDGSPGIADKLLCKSDGTTATATCLGDGELDAYNYFDASATAFIGEHTEVTVGVNNIADKEPPMVGTSLATNANAPGGYDQAGRFFFGSITFRF